MTEKCFEERFRDVEENYKVITNRIAEAAVRSGRKPEDITFLAATKTVPAEVINHAIGCGLRFIGENRVQEFMDKYEKIDWDKGASASFLLVLITGADFTTGAGIGFTVSVFGG